MSGQRFASWPTFNSQRVLLEGDTRLVRAPNGVTLLGPWTRTLTSTNMVLESGHIIDVSGLDSVRLEYNAHATTSGGTIASAIYLAVDYQPIGEVTWTPLLSGPTVTATTDAIGISAWTGIGPAIQVLGDVRLRVRAIGTSGAAAGGSFIELQLRYTSTLLAGPDASGQSVQVEVDFGHAGGGEDTFTTTTVAAPWVGANTVLLCTSAPVGTADHDADDAAVEGLIVYATNLVPGVGFDVVASAVNGTWGRYLINAVAL